MGVYLHTDEWLPWENTIAYFPFESDTLDYSWNDTTLSGSGTKATIGYTYSADAKLTNPNILYASVWLNKGTLYPGYDCLTYGKLGYIGYNMRHNQSNLNNKIAIFADSNFTIWGTSDWFNSNEWHHRWWTRDGTNLKIEKDGVVSTLYSGSVYNFDNTWVFSLNHLDYWSWSVTYSKLVVEDRTRTAQQMTDYYNQTKSDYGL